MKTSTYAAVNAFPFGPTGILRMMTEAFFGICVALSVYAGRKNLTFISFSFKEADGKTLNFFKSILSIFMHTESNQL
jgi:hypothetical protein